MKTTPFFIAATLSVLLPSIINLADRAKRSAPVHVIATTVWAAFMIVPVVTRYNWPVLTVTLIIMIAANFIVIRIVRNESAAKSVLILTNIILCIVTFANSSWISDFNGPMHTIAEGIEKSYAIIARLPVGTGHRLSVTLFGLALVTAGINHPIVFVLKAAGLAPADMHGDDHSNPRLTSNEPARGRVIGYLERIIVFLLMISNNTAAIGFVLAAKAFARFKQLDKRDFAEYVLIGTLMSFGATIVISIVLSGLM